MQNTKSEKENMKDIGEEIISEFEDMILTF